MSFLQLTALGRLGRDPEFKTFNGKEVANFSIAVDVWRKGGKQTQWISVSSWNERTNKVLKDFVIKGSQVLVIGQPSLRSYEKNGQTEMVLELDISFGSLTLAGGKAEPLDRVPDTAGKKTPALADDDIPF